MKLTALWKTGTKTSSEATTLPMEEQEFTDQTGVVPGSRLAEAAYVAQRCSNAHLGGLTQGQRDRMVEVLKVKYPDIDDVWLGAYLAANYIFDGMPTNEADHLKMVERGDGGDNA